MIKVLNVIKVKYPVSKNEFAINYQNKSTKSTIYVVPKLR